MKAVLVALLASYLRTVLCGECATCSAWFDYPVCGHNERCYAPFKNSCEMEMVNCKMPEDYKFIQTVYYGHCFRPNVNKCNTVSLKQKLEKRDKSVEIFA